MSKTFVEQQIQLLNNIELRELLNEKEIALKYLIDNKINKIMQKILKSEIKTINHKLSA